MWGRGIGLILSACEKAHLAAPKIYEDRGFVYTVFARPTAQEWQGKVGEAKGLCHARDRPSFAGDAAGCAAD